MSREHRRQSQNDAPVEHRAMQPGQQLGLQQPHGVGGSRVSRGLPVRVVEARVFRALIKLMYREPSIQSAFECRQRIAEQICPLGHGTTPALQLTDTLNELVEITSKEIQGHEET